MLINMLVEIATLTDVPLADDGNISEGMIQLTKPVLKAKLEI